MSMNDVLIDWFESGRLIGSYSNTTWINTACPLLDQITINQAIFGYNLFNFRIVVNLREKHFADASGDHWTAGCVVSGRRTSRTRTRSSARFLLRFWRTDSLRLDTVPIRALRGDFRQVEVTTFSRIYTKWVELNTNLIDIIWNFAAAITSPIPVYRQHVLHLQLDISKSSSQINPNVGLE